MFSKVSLRFRNSRIGEMRPGLPGSSQPQLSNSAAPGLSERDLQPASDPCSTRPVSPPRRGSLLRSRQTRIKHGGEARGWEINTGVGQLPPGPTSQPASFPCRTRRCPVLGARGGTTSRAARAPVASASARPDPWWAPAQTARVRTKFPVPTGKPGAEWPPRIPPWRQPGQGTCLGARGGGEGPRSQAGISRRPCRARAGGDRGAAFG